MMSHGQKAGEGDALQCRCQNSDDWRETHTDTRRCRNERLKKGVVEGGARDQNQDTVYKFWTRLLEK